MSEITLSHLITEAYRKRDSLTSCSSVHIVMGNESCDLDSAVSALCYALLLHSEKCNHGTENVAVVPLLNIPRDDFPLRTESGFLFRECSLPSDQLLFRDDVDLHCLHNSGLLKLTLVDHHVLPAQDAYLMDCVVEVLDHRPRDPSQTFPPSCRVDVRTVGSCASLVAEQIMVRAPQLLDAQVATLISGTVLLDTACFSPEADRTTPLDVAVVEACESRLGIAADRAVTFQRLVDARKDVSALSSLQLLHKDMKFVRGLPLPGMPLLVKNFLSRPDASSALSAFCAKHKTKTVVVMGMCFASGQLRRDLLVYSEGSPQLAGKLIEALQTAEDLSAKRVPCDVPGVVLFEQTNLKISRKQILPILKVIVDQHEERT